MANMDRSERLADEASDLETPYDEVVSPLGDVPEPVIPSKPTSSTGPIVKTHSTKTKDHRTVDVMETKPIDSPSKTSTSRMPPPQSQPAHRREVKSSTISKPPAATSMVITKPTSSIEDWNTEIDEDPHPDSRSATWTEYERARMLRKKMFQDAKSLGLQPEDDPLSPNYKPPTGVVTSPAIEAHMEREHAKEAANMDTRAVVAKQKENVRNRPDPKQLVAHCGPC